MKDAVLYIHGKGGSAAESNHYKALFPDYEMIGLDFQTLTPWETGTEIRAAAEELKAEYESIILIANSIGAFFSMNAGIGHLISKAYFISPIVNMEKLITDMMQWANVTEKELKSKGVIHTAFGEDLSWKYLCYVREHPIDWKVPTSILYGSRDNLTSFETISDFAKKHRATLTVMESGEHWFHTEEQIRFLDDWIRSSEGENLCSHLERGTHGNGTADPRFNPGIG
jgi:pimeloyl-ACP methyl ester carboxylesterase